MSAPAITPKRSLNRVSPSAIKAYRSCPRKWYDSYILGNRDPEKPFQLKGTAIHSALEHYLKTGEVMPIVSLPDPLKNGAPTEFNTLEFVQVAQPHLPPPATDRAYWEPIEKEGGGLFLEQLGDMGTYSGGPSFVQYIDQVWAQGKTAKITDYKTLSDLRYGSTPEELSQDTQLCDNAKWLFAVSDYEEIEIGHLYLLTKMYIQRRSRSTSR